MLYKRRIVKIPRPITSEMRTLARRHTPFRLSDDAFDWLQTEVGSRKKGLRQLEEITEKLASAIRYDHVHSFEGCRNAEQTFENGKGHCIEQNILLSAYLRRLGIPHRLLITKNPHLYSGDFDNPGVHPFIVYEIDSRRYTADAVSGEICKLDEHYFLDCAYYSFREFVAFYLSDSGEDVGIGKKKPKEAVEYLRLAIRVNPNDYVIQTILADIFAECGNLEEAGKLYRNAVGMAPTSTYALIKLGEFEQFVMNNPLNALKNYLRVIRNIHDGCQEYDIHNLFEIRKRFQALEMPDLAAVCIAIIFCAINEDRRIRKYFYLARDGYEIEYGKPDFNPIGLSLHTRQTRD